MKSDDDNLAERFWCKVNRSGQDECWIWTGAKLKGYGLIRVANKVLRAHRLSYQLTNGVDPGEMNVLHRCDNPSCVNPTHLFLGAHQQNMEDRERKGRGVRLRGEDHGMHRLTAVRVEEIRQLYATGDWKQRDLATKFGVCQRTISLVVNRKTWTGA